MMGTQQITKKFLCTTDSNKYFPYCFVKACDVLFLTYESRWLSPLSDGLHSWRGCVPFAWVRAGRRRHRIHMHPTVVICAQQYITVAADLVAPRSLSARFGYRRTEELRNVQWANGQHCYCGSDPKVAVGNTKTSHIHSWQCFTFV
jgi:hypothetical protein